jgi:uncharacterized membrane protein YeiB
MTPVESSTESAGDRIQSLDILRGLALLGMFVVHFHERSAELSGIDELVRTLVWRLVESKSHGTFALLFGAGFAIQLRRAEVRRRPFTALYLRASPCWRSSDSPRTPFSASTCCSAMRCVECHCS